MRRSWILGVLALALGAGCAAVLGFEDTTVRPDADGGSSGSSGSSDSSGSSGSSGTDGSSPADGGLDTGVTLPAFSVAPAKVTVIRNQGVKLTVTLARNGVAGAVVVRLTGLPTGVTAPDGTIPASASTVDINVSATTAAIMGIASGVKVIAPSTPAVPDLPLDFTVAGVAGSLDESFDNDGIRTDAIGGNTASAAALVVQPDGKIVAGGGNLSTWILRRYNADGSPDTAFNTNAAAAVQTSGDIRALALDPVTQKIVAVGVTTAPAPTQATIMRLNTDGSADGAFGSGGVYRFDNVGFGGGSTAEGVVVEADSNILVAGSKITGVTTVAILHRLNKTTGVYTNLHTGIDKTKLVGVALEPGKIVAGGADSNTGPGSSLVVRLNAVDGGVSPDTTVTGGTGLSLFVSSCKALGFIRRPDGEYIVTGQDPTGPNFCSAAAKPANAAFDWSFNRPFGNSSQFTAAAAQADNRTFIVGYGGGSMDKFASIDRVTPAGATDPTWNPLPDGGAGSTLKFEDPATPDTYIYAFRAVAVDAIGRVIVGGNKNNAGMTLIRMWP